MNNVLHEFYDNEFLAFRKYFDNQQLAVNSFIIE